MSALFENPAFRIAGKAARLLFIPFPIATVACFVLVSVLDYMLRPDRSDIVSGEPGEMLGGILIFVAVGGLQAVIGIPSLLILDSKHAKINAFLAIGTVLALGFSSFLALMLRAPQFGETFLWMFSWIFCLFGLPLIGCYCLAAVAPFRLWKEIIPTSQST